MQFNAIPRTNTTKMRVVAWMNELVYNVRINQCIIMIIPHLRNSWNIVTINNQDEDNRLNKSVYNNNNSSFEKYLKHYYYNNQDEDNRLNKSVYNNNNNNNSSCEKYQKHYYYNRDEDNSLKCISYKVRLLIKKNKKRLTFIL